MFIYLLTIKIIFVPFVINFVIVLKSQILFWFDKRCNINTVCNANCIYDCWNILFFHCLSLIKTFTDVSLSSKQQATYNFLQTEMSWEFSATRSLLLFTHHYTMHMLHLFSANIRETSYDDDETMIKKV